MSPQDGAGAAGSVTIGATTPDTATRAASLAATVLREALADRGAARVVFASAPSQDAMVRALGESEGIDWDKVTSLHLDEYRGIDPGHPAGFGRWLADRLPVAAQPGLNRIAPGGDSSAEIARYEQSLAEGPIDLVCLGIGVNGHLAFNEPDDTDFHDPASMREVELRPASRQQQVDEGLFGDLDEVPTHALSMTVSAIMSAGAIVGTVLGKPKAEAVAAALTGPITPELPASALRTHPRMHLFLDPGAASGLPAELSQLPEGHLVDRASSY